MLPTYLLSLGTIDACFMKEGSGNQAAPAPEISSLNAGRSRCVTKLVAVGAVQSPRRVFGSPVPLLCKTKVMGLSYLYVRT